MKKVRVLVHRKEERAFLEVLQQMIEKQNIIIQPLKMRKDEKTLIELCA